MNPRMRKLLLIIAAYISAHKAEGKMPCIQDIARMAAMNDVSVADELREMKGMGLVGMELTQRSTSTVMEISLTAKAKRLLPRVREINGQAQ